MRPRSSRVVQHFPCFYHHAQTAVDAGDIRTWRTTVILVTGKPEDPQFELHAIIKMGVISLVVYLCNNWSPIVRELGLDCSI